MIRLTLAFFLSLIPLSSKARDADHVTRRVMAQAEAKLGKRWVPVAVRIAHVESRMNPKALGPRSRSGRPAGVFQVMPGTARGMGFSPSRLTELEYGIAAGLEHMRRCIAAGVRTDKEMAACHVSGFAGWRARHSPYVSKYIALVVYK